MPKNNLQDRDGSEIKPVRLAQVKSWRALNANQMNLASTLWTMKNKEIKKKKKNTSSSVRERKSWKQEISLETVIVKDKKMTKFYYQNIKNW